MPDANTVELILEEAGEKRAFPLGAAPCGIGRGGQNTIVLQSHMVSRNHAMVQRNESGGYSVFDLGSRNGTFLNGRRLVGPADLRHGDVLSIGSFMLIFSGVAERPAAPQPAPPVDSQQTLVHLTLREITVLVVDIRDFTGLTLGLGAARIAEVISAFNRETGAILETAGTWAVKYIGDAVMAVWAHPDYVGASLLRTVFRTVVAIQGMADRFQNQYDLPRQLRVGAGIDSGPASIGNLGSAVNSDYTALGDVVNKAFRLEASTRTLNADLAFGEAIRLALGGLGDRLVCASQIRLKGYTEPCNVYSMQAADLPQLLSLLEAELAGS